MVCQQIYSSSVSIAGVDFTVFGALLSLCLVASMAVLLVFLHNVYKQTYQRDRLPLRMLLETGSSLHQPHRPLMAVSPEYYAYSQIMCIFFVLQAVAWLLRDDTALTKWLQNDFIWGVSLWADLWILSHLCIQPRFVSTTLCSLAIASCECLVVFVILPDSDCSWCTLHFPKKGVEFLYIPSALILVLLMLMASKQLSIGPLAPRPPLIIWASFMLVPYAGSAIAICAVRFAGAEWGYCMLALLESWYTLLFVPVLYHVARTDSSQRREQEMALALGCSTMAPLSESLDLQDLASSKARTALMTLLTDHSIRIIPPQDLQMGCKLGRGNFSTVYAASWQTTPVAVKKLGGADTLFEKSQPAERKKMATELVHEVSVLARLRHPHVVLFLGIVINEDYHGIVTEMLDGQSLGDRIGDGSMKVLSWKNRLRILLHTAQGVAYLHSCNIIHRDLKSFNVLLDNLDLTKAEAKVADFGLSTLSADESGTLSAVGTTQWTAPEVLRRQHYTQDADTYSFSIVMWELAACLLPYAGRTPFEIGHAVAYQKERLVIPKTCPPSVAALMAACWVDLTDEECVGSESEDGAATTGGRPTFSAIVDRLQTLKELERF